MTLEATPVAARVLPAEGVPVRLVVRPRGYLEESLLLLHLPRLAIILAFVTVGSFLAPRVDLALYATELAAVALGVGLGAYRLDELRDRTTAVTIPQAHHRVLAATGLGVGVVIGLGLALSYTPWLLLPMALGLLGIVGYNTVKALHRPSIYALTWGALPVWASYSLQTLAPPSPAVLLAGVAAGAFALEHLWTWGLRRCGRGPVCAKEQNALRGGTNAPCHSPAIRCATRLTMPDETNAHAKVLLRLQYALVAALTGWVVLSHAGFA